MRPVEFKECNSIYKAPPDLAESQCMTIAAFRGAVTGGSIDGAPITVVAWKPDEQELEAIKKGLPIYLTFIGGLPPHYPSTSFEEATNPA